MKKYILFFAFSLLVTGLTSCDDGRIYENTGFVPREGRVLKLSGKFSGINKWSEGYIIARILFLEEKWIFLFIRQKILIFIIYFQKITVKNRNMIKQNGIR